MFWRIGRSVGWFVCKVRGCLLYFGREGMPKLLEVILPGNWENRCIWRYERMLLLLLYVCVYAFRYRYQMGRRLDYVTQ